MTTKKGSQNFWPGKLDIFRLESKISATGFTTLQTSNQIDAAGAYALKLNSFTMLICIAYPKALKQQIVQNVFEI